MYNHVTYEHVHHQAAYVQKLHMYMYNVYTIVRVNVGHIMYIVRVHKDAPAWYCVWHLV